jgi:3-oxoacyl-[acyl-carrier-protein] synthase II
MCSRRRVVITGIGLVTPLGHTPEDFFANLMAAKSGVRHLETDFVSELGCKIAAWVDDFDPLKYFSKSQAATIDRATQFAMAASRHAVKDARLELGVENGERIGVYIGTGMGGAQTIEDSYARLFREQANRLKPYTVLMGMNNAASAQVALDFGFTGANITFCAACASSAVSVGEAVRQIRHGYADVMLAGGAESLLTYGTIKAWEALRTLANEDANLPSASCKPFSLNRTGLVLGEGAAMFVLEEMDRAIARGAYIYGEVIGYGSSNDSSHITQPSIEGQARAMRKALEDAKVSPNMISYINAHGTGTKLNDAVETAAIKQIFGTDVPISSTKSMHGHLMGAAAAVEFAACLMAIKKQALPPTAHLLERDPELDLDYIPNAGRESVDVDIVMSNSFAFGGTSGVLIARKFSY